MVFSVSSDGIEFSLDFGPDSVTLAVKDLVQKMTIRSREKLLAAWSLLLSQGQEFLNNHLALFSVNPNQQKTHKLRHEVLSRVGAQVMDTSGSQVFDRDVVEFYWQNDRLDVDSVFEAGIDTLFLPTAFEDLEIGRSTKTPFCSTKRDEGELSSNNTSL